MNNTEELIGIFGALCDYMTDNGGCDVSCPFAETKDEDDECEAWRKIQKIRQEENEAKRLLKLAVDDFSNMYNHIFDYDGMCGTCTLHGERDHCLKWRYADEALKLIGGSKND